MQKNTKKILIALFILTFGVLVFRGALAQEFTQEDYDKILEEFYNKASSLVQQKTSNFEIKLSPEYPDSHTNITAKIISYSFDSDRSYITWTLNGKIIEQGRGKKSISFKTGSVGTTIYLTASVTTEKNITTEAAKEIKISTADLLWQTFSYTPPFYKGKAMPTQKNTVKITAIPHGLGSSKNLIYEWERNFKNQPNLSGLGKKSISFPFTDISSKEVVSVKISTLDKSQTIEKTIDVIKKAPEIIFYEESPLEGVLYQKALSNEIQLTQPEIVIRAEPYFFSESDINSISYTWKMNQEPIEPLSKANTIGLSRPSDSTNGTTIINLQIKNINKYFQQITKSLKLNF